MKEKFTKSFAFLMLAWYCVCLVGFDVHTCFRSGESIVSSLLVGADCEGLHHHCEGDRHSVGESCRCGALLSDSAKCFSESPAGSSDLSVCPGTPCCSDDVILFDVVASGSAREDVHAHHGHCTCHCGFCPDGIDDGMTLSDASFAPSSVPLPVENQLLPSCVERSVISVWRL